MGHRKRPSLHIRFRDFLVLDKIEIWAHQRGQKIIPWARRALIKQAREESAQEIISKTVQDACLEMLILLREIAGPEQSAQALARINDFKSKVRADVAKSFE